MKIKNIKKTLFIFLVASFLVLVIVPGTMAIFSEKERATINLNVESPVFTVAFDANGGTTSVASKEVAYLHEYGELPTAEKCGSNFVGWYTGIGDGIKIEDTSVFNVYDNQTLYARYESDGVLYNVLKCEAERTDVEPTARLAATYTGEHQDSMDASKSTETIYHFYGSNTNNGKLILEENNIVFANMCWQMIRTTDTGGVKLLYNGVPTITEVDGNLQYYCGVNRTGNFSSKLTSTNLSGSYYYSNSYTTTITNDDVKYTLVDPVVVTVNSDNAQEKIPYILENYQYTCWSSTTSTSLFKLDSYSGSGTSVSGYSAAKRDQIGYSEYNTHSNSISSVGYMYNSNFYTTTSYDYKYYDVVEYEYLYTSTLDTYKDYYFGDNYVISGDTYVLSNPRKGESISSYPSSWKGKYLCKDNSSSSCDEVYYVSGVKTSGTQTLYLLKIDSSREYNDPAYKLLVSDSIADNGDGTIEMFGNVQEILKADWSDVYESTLNKFVCLSNYYSYDSTNNKYICNDNNEQKVGVLSYVTSSSQRNFVGNPVYLYGYGFSEYGDSYKLVSKNNEQGTLQYLYDYDSNKVADCFDNDEDKISKCGRKTLTRSHYTCYNMTGICDTHYYMNFAYSYATSMEIPNGKYVSTDLTDKNNVLYLMLYQNDENGLVNTTDSEVKMLVDNWYENNLLEDYDSYIEDVIYCNDREITDISTYNPDGGQLQNTSLKFRNNADITDLSCKYITDKFSVSNQFAPLKYKVALLTSPELNLLNQNSARTGTYLYYTMSPSYIYDANRVSFVRKISYDGTEASHLVYSVSSGFGNRPSISLIPGITYSSGSGSTTDPYIIDTSGA